MHHGGAARCTEYAITAICTVALLKAFSDAQTLSNAPLFWQTIIHLTFAICAVLFALTDYIVEKSKRCGPGAPEGRSGH